MKLLASTLLLGAVTAASPPQQVLSENFNQAPLQEAAKPISDAWAKGLHTLGDKMKGMTAEAKSIWD